MAYLIYKHTSRTSGKSYIGVAKHNMEKRLTYHLWEAECGSTFHFHRALRKYGREDFISTILENDLDKKGAFEQEQYYIVLYDTFKNGYNMTEGGDRGPVRRGEDNGMYGKKHTEEARRLMSEKKKLLVGEKHPHYGKTSPLKGKTYEEIVGAERAKELRKERSRAVTGIKRPYNSGENNHAKRPEVRAKISKARRKPITINGITYECKLDACEKLGISRYKLNKLI